MLDTGELYIWGWPLDFQSLVFNNTMRRNVPRALSLLQSLPFGWPSLNTAVLAPLPLLDGVACVATGGCYTGAINQDGALITRGMNRCRCLGRALPLTAERQVRAARVGTQRLCGDAEAGRYWGDG